MLLSPGGCPPSNLPSSSLPPLHPFPDLAVLTDWGGGLLLGAGFSSLPQTCFIPTVRWLQGLRCQEVAADRSSLGPATWWQSPPRLARPPLPLAWVSFSTVAVATLRTAAGPADGAGAGKLPRNLVCRGPRPALSLARQETQNAPPCALLRFLLRPVAVCGCSSTCRERSALLLLALRTLKKLSFKVKYLVPAREYIKHDHDINRKIYTQPGLSPDCCWWKMWLSVPRI